MEELAPARLETWLRLMRSGLNVRTLRTLLEQYPDTDHLLAATARDLEHHFPHARGVTRRLRAAQRADVSADLAWLAGAGRHLIHFHDPHYPPRLKEIADPPPALFVAGSPAALCHPQLALVGSRNPTPYGHEIAFRLAYDLSTQLVITSGLAVGIDADAHRGALRAGKSTVAVFGTGLDRVYPRRHRRLAADITARGGALVSEFPTTTPPRRHHFPRRNRLISGMSIGTLVVEATLKSGSLITAYQAVEQNREVYAVPGSVDSPLSAGCHHLIQQGAKLVGSAADILEDFEPAEGVEPRIATSALEQRLLDAMGFEAATVDVLALRTGLTAEQVSSMLLQMEVRGAISHCPGGGYLKQKNAVGEHERKRA